MMTPVIRAITRLLAGKANPAVVNERLKAALG